MHGVPDTHPVCGEQHRVEPREWEQDVPAGGIRQRTVRSPSVRCGGTRPTWTRPRRLSQSHRAANTPALQPEGPCMWRHGGVLLHRGPAAQRRSGSWLLSIDVSGCPQSRGLAKAWCGGPRAFDFGGSLSWLVSSTNILEPRESGSTAICCPGLVTELLLLCPKGEGAV